MYKYLFIGVGVSLVILLALYYSDYQVFLMFAWPMFLFLGFSFGFNHKIQQKNLDQESRKVFYTIEKIVNEPGEKLFGRGLILGDCLFLIWLCTLA